MFPESHIPVLFYFHLPFINADRRSYLFWCFANFWVESDGSSMNLLRDRISTGSNIETSADRTFCINIANTIWRLVCKFRTHMNYESRQPCRRHHCKPFSHRSFFLVFVHWSFYRWFPYLEVGETTEKSNPPSRFLKYCQHCDERRRLLLKTFVTAACAGSCVFIR